jgi:FtsP/CotA-like multicopper oxidase with cupredoxin domain
VTALRRLATILLAGAVLAAAAYVGWSWWSSRLPGTYNVMDYGTADFGGGPRAASAVEHARMGHGRSVVSLTGPLARPDKRFVLTARKATVRLASGRTIDALTFDGRVPGPELRVRQGDLVEVKLVNRDVEAGVTIHWHGVDVPNAEDGVAGVTQDAVRPGGSYTYRFRMRQAGTFWYHTHEASSEEVGRGLYGALVGEPRRPAREAGLDLTLVAHEFGGVQTLNASDGVQARAVAPGTPVRLRLVNSENGPQTFTVAGTPFRVVAIDGTDLNEPSVLDDEVLELAAGGRYDVAFTMPPRPVAIGLAGTNVRLALSRDGRGDAVAPRSGDVFDPLAYGRPRPTPFGAGSRFDRRFELVIGRKPGFLDGRPGFHWTLNGHIYPDVPMFVVRRGDLVRMTIRNSTGSVHPMHLHGHHMLVLSRDGVPASGSPWWTDTLDVHGKERYELAFRADNPGLWMDHCHNLHHAAAGLTMHLAYEGFGTPFEVGGRADNRPE